MRGQDVVVALCPTPSGMFALMQDGRIFERMRDPKNFDGRNPDRWIWVEREGPIPKAE